MSWAAGTGLMCGDSGNGMVRGATGMDDEDRRGQRVPREGVGQALILVRVRQVCFFKKDHRVSHYSSSLCVPFVLIPLIVVFLLLHLFVKLRSSWPL